MIIKNNSTLGERKNMNLPGTEIDLPTITEKDKKDIVDFGVKHQVDLISLSFSRYPGDILGCRELLGEEGKHIKICAKIESLDGLNNYMKILSVTDSIMVARGDMGMEIPPQKVFVAQKWMIKKANEQGVPVITATQMMESMIKNPRPTRAEASDVGNAVLDGTDAVMLSGETANGAFPVAAVDIMAKVCSEAELCVDYSAVFVAMMKLNKSLAGNRDAVASTAVQLSMQLGAKGIFCLTESGNTARKLAKFKPRTDIFALT